MIKKKGTKAYDQIVRILEHAKKNNIYAGIHNGTAEYASQMIKLGFNFVTVGSDQRFMSAGAKSSIENLKGLKGEKIQGY